ncbi:Ubiquitin-like protein [Spraguea lophii 42_110]|uniref:Ubiquitin-like protein n=1 Tax=Spraguea lophii (strain 42_110) TaxID=1358809 RepID=S7W5N9_SPRLO|nr:Ubiquitin-like protein [Spraguea lophii 42_110]
MDNKDEIEFNIDDYAYELEPPIEPLVHIPLEIEKDYTTFDDTLEKSQIKLHTNILELYNINLMENISNYLNKDIEQPKKQSHSWLRRAEYISGDYFKKQERRSEALKKEINRHRKEEINVNNFMKQSFIDIDEIIGEVEEEYELIPGNIKYSGIMFQDDIEVTKNMTFLKDDDDEILGYPNRIIEANSEQTYSATAKDMSDYLVIEIKDNKATFSEIDKILKIKPCKKINKNN